MKWSTVGILTLSCTMVLGGIDSDWMSMLNNPPALAVSHAAALETRADGLVSSLLTTSQLSLGDVDVVVSGGGNFDAYYLGVQMIFSRVQTHAGSNMTIHRFAGASAGGMMPFELRLKGENTTLVEHLSYGLLEQENPIHYSSTAIAAALQDHHWRLMAHWMTNKWASSLSTLDNVVFLALSCLDPLPKQVKVSNFTSPEQAEKAFMATGTYEETYDGMICSDGGAESGPKMTPLFQDGVRPQVIVDLMETGFPTTMVFKYNMSQYENLIQKGQDEAVTFLQTGKVRADAITLCPKGADVSKQVCKTSH